MKPRVAGLQVRLASRAPVRNLEKARLIPGEGMDQDHARGGRRGLTLLSAEGWRAAAEEIGQPELDWTTRRANVLLEGLDLRDSRSRRLRLGDCLVEITGPCPPCERMEEAAPGLLEALTRDGRAGVTGRVLEGGELHVGQEAAWED